jgi:hypothetical protein
VLLSFAMTNEQKNKQKAFVQQASIKLWKEMKIKIGK